MRESFNVIQARPSTRPSKVAVMWKKFSRTQTAPAKCDAEKYRLLQAAAQVELCRRAIGREPEVSDWQRWAKSGDPPIHPFAVLSNEQIEQVLCEAMGRPRVR
jgi:hypothetical protein